MTNKINVPSEQMNGAAVVAALNILRQYREVTSDNLHTIISLRDMTRPLLYIKVNAFEIFHQEELRDEFSRICNLLRGDE